MSSNYVEIPPIYTAVIESPVGKLLLEAKGEVVQKIHFIEDSQPVVEPVGVLIPAAQQLTEYFKGSRLVFDFPIHAEGTHFQQNVWDQLRKIEFGRTISYEVLARQLGDIKVIRAAASANGRNPLAIVIPCHRVIGKDGSLTGYSGGMWRKKFLLELELGQKAPTLFE